MPEMKNNTHDFSVRTPKDDSRRWEAVPTGASTSPCYLGGTLCQFEIGEK